MFNELLIRILVCYFLVFLRICNPKNLQKKTLKKINLYSLGSVDAEILRPLLGVEERFIRAALDEIKQKYGSVENFIRDELKIRDESIVELKNFLLTES